MAAANNNIRGARLLLDAGADTNVADSSGVTPLHWAIGEGSVEMVSLLLDAGADANSIDDHGATPLLMAISEDDPAIVLTLLEEGADPNTRRQMTYLDVAMFLYRLGEGEAKHVVLTLGPSLGIPDEVLDIVTGGDDLLTAFIEAADLDVVGEEPLGTFSPLYIAVVGGNPEIVAHLLDAGADPLTGAEPVGQSPAEAAALLGRQEMQALLGDATP